MSVVRRVVALLLLASLAGTAAPLCRCLPGPAAGSPEGGHECCARQSDAAWQAAGCCPAAPAGLTSAPAPEAPPLLVGLAPLPGLVPLPAARPGAPFLAPSPPAPPRSSSILRV